MASMGVNTWTPEQWRAYNAATGDRHVARRERPVFQREVLAEDVAQQAELYKLTRRACDCPDAYKRREMAFIRLTCPMTYAMTGDAPDGDD